MNQLEEIKARVERVPQVAPGVVSEEAADALKLIAALEAVEELCEQDYMMSPEQIRNAITEALK